MKLRIRGNTLRLRLTRGEVAEIRSRGEVSEQIDFPGNRLRYRLQSRDDASAIRAELGDGTITVVVPAADANRWADSGAVSLQAEQPLPAGEQLGLLIEKDFACLTERPGEDDSDAFPHPEAG